MPCYKPYTAYRCRTGKSENGKHPIVFNKSLGIPGTELKVACSQCYGCRLERSRIWAIRCEHEAKLHLHNQFLTLTYNDESLSTNSISHTPNTLIPQHLKDFWKRLRKHGFKFRYYACGEYGDKTNRPHYHSICFGLELPDKRFLKRTRSGTLYTSHQIDKIWGHGHVYIGNVTFESCAYVARYCLKKKRGTAHEIEQEYGRFSPATGEIWQVLPEFQTASRGGTTIPGQKNPGGIGTEWYNKHKKDIYQNGTDGILYIRGGIPSKPPSFYELKYESESFQQFNQVEKIKQKRRELNEERAEDNTPARLATKEKIAQHRANHLLPRLQE